MEAETTEADVSPDATDASETISSDREPEIEVGPATDIRETISVNWFVNGGVRDQMIRLLYETAPWQEVESLLADRNHPLGSAYLQLNDAVGRITDPVATEPIEAQIETLSSLLESIVKWCASSKGAPWQAVDEVHALHMQRRFILLQQLVQEFDITSRAGVRLQTSVSELPTASGLMRTMDPEELWPMVPKDEPAEDPPAPSTDESDRLQLEWLRRTIGDVGRAVDALVDVFDNAIRALEAQPAPRFLSVKAKIERRQKLKNDFAQLKGQLDSVHTSVVDRIADAEAIDPSTQDDAHVAHGVAVLQTSFHALMTGTTMNELIEKTCHFVDQLPNEGLKLQIERGMPDNPSCKQADVLARESVNTLDRWKGVAKYMSGEVAW